MTGSIIRGKFIAVRPSRLKLLPFTAAFFNAVGHSSQANATLRLKGLGGRKT